MDIVYSLKATKFLKKLSKGNKKDAASIIAEIENYVLNPQGNFDIKTLKGQYEDFKRLRVGNY